MSAGDHGVVGHAAAIAALTAAAAGDAFHHAWLFAGPPGIGKASLARVVARRLLADAATPGRLAPGLGVPGDHPTHALMAAGSHPDYRVLQRLPKDGAKTDDELARSITVAQVRSLGSMFATAPALAPRRVVLIDAVDDLERSGANALLKGLEEPPAGTAFLLVSHAPGRLLPTIRSRCRLLRLEALSSADTAAIVSRLAPDLPAGDLMPLVEASEGSPGRALALSGLAVADLDAAIRSIAATGDPDNARRGALARALGAKGAQRRYELFLDRARRFVAREAERRGGAALARALDAHRAAADLANAATGLSLDPAATVFEMGGILARLA